MAKIYTGLVCWFGIVCVGSIGLESTSSILSPNGWILVLVFGGVGVLLLPCVAANRRAGILPSCFLALLAGWVVYRCWISPVEYAARHDLALIGVSVIAYFLGQCLGIRSGFARIVVCLLVVLGVANLGVALYQYFADPSFTPWPGSLPRDVGKRATGFFPNANHLSALIEIIAPCCLALAFFLRKASAKVFFGYVGIALVVGSLFSGSRGGAISMIAALFLLAVLVFWLRLRRSRKRFFCLALGCVLVGVLSVGSLYVFQQANTARGNKAIIGDRARFDLWTSVVQQFQTSPVIGTGSLTYEVFARRHRPSDWNSGERSDPRLAHNDYLQFLAEYGLVGAVLMFMFVVSHLYNGWRYLADRSASGDVLGWTVGLAAGVLCSLAAVAVHEFFDFNLHIYALAVLVAILFGWLGVLRCRGERDISQGWRIIPVSVLLGSVSLVFYLGKTAYRSERALVSGFQHLGKQDHFPAIADLRKAVQIDPVNYSAWIALGRANQEMAVSLPLDSPPQKSYLGKAAQAFDAAIRLYPENAYLQILAAQNFDLMKLYDRAEDAYRKALELAPNHKIYRSFYANHLYTYGYWSRNVDMLKMAEEFFKSGHYSFKSRAKNTRELIKAIEAGNAKTAEQVEENPELDSPREN